MSVIEATSVAVRTMADGTLRLSVDIDPSHSQAAFALFGMPGSPMALAALTQQAAQESAQKSAIAHAQKPFVPKGGNLSKDAAMICNDEMFREWVSVCDGSPVIATSERAAEFMRENCCILSRAELDNDPEAADRFKLLMKQYREWLKGEGECLMTP